VGRIILKNLATGITNQFDVSPYVTVCGFCPGDVLEVTVPNGETVSAVVGANGCATVRVPDFYDDYFYADPAAYALHVGLVTEEDMARCGKPQAVNIEYVPEVGAVSVCTYWAESFTGGGTYRMCYYVKSEKSGHLFLPQSVLVQKVTRIGYWHIIGGECRYHEVDTDKVYADILTYSTDGTPAIHIPIAQLAQVCVRTSYAGTVCTPLGMWSGTITIYFT